MEQAWAGLVIDYSVFPFVLCSLFLGVDTGQVCCVIVIRWCFGIYKIIESGVGVPCV